MRLLALEIRELLDRQLMGRVMWIDVNAPLLGDDAKIEQAHNFVDRLRDDADEEALPIGRIAVGGGAGRSSGASKRRAISCTMCKIGPQPRLSPSMNTSLGISVGVSTVWPLWLRLSGVW